MGKALCPDGLRCWGLSCLHNFWPAGWAVGQCTATNNGRKPVPLLFPMMRPPLATVPEGFFHDLEIGVLYPLCTSSIFPETPWPPPMALADSIPMHSHGGQAGQQIRAGRKTRAINYLLPLFLKISSQGNDPKEKSKYKCIHNSSASNSTTLGKSQQYEVAN